MNIYLARQPILDINKKIIAYELLYRGKSLTMDATDGNLATMNVITNTFMNIGFEDVVTTGSAFLNFTGDLIKKEIPKIFDKERVVIEILEHVEPDELLIERIKELKEIGYTIALDDFVLDYQHEEILELVDIVKVDFLLTKKIERMKIVYRLNKYNVQILAEKVETFEEFEEAKKLSCVYFQGYFFEKPQIIQSKEIKPLNTSHMLAIEELSKDDPDYDHLVDIIKSDFSLVYKFLKLVNSVAFYSRSKIESLERALITIGFTEINKYIFLLMLQEISSGSLAILVETALIRAKFAENIAGESKYSNDKNSFFLVGMFSLVDAIIGGTKEEALEVTPICTDIKAGIIGSEDNKYSKMIEILELYEKGEFESVEKKLNYFNINMEIITDSYIEALKWEKKIDLKSI